MAGENIQPQSNAQVAPIAKHNRIKGSMFSLRAADVQSYRICDELSGVLIFAMIVPPTVRRVIFVLAFAANCAIAFRTQAHGDLHERIAAITAQILTNSSNPELWLQRADLHRQHGEFDAAQTDLDQAVRLKPGWANAALQQVRISFDRQNFPDAVRAAGDCLKLDPANADALVLRARSFVRLNEPSRAIADYDAVLNRTNSARPLPDLFLERARAQAALGKFGDAVHGLDDAMRRLGDTPSFAVPAIEYERQRGAFEAALARLERADKFFDRESFLALRGEILLQAGRPADAENDFQTALARLEQFPAGRRAQSSALEARLRAGLKQAMVSAPHPHP
ncbi:MAG: tetratricopeptide repeat protein [Verrucomicrobiales bacterium]|nr:tetratricopeptide repeat protein [Verrucomicrobiales bacterium]